MTSPSLPPLPEPTLEDVDYELWGQNAKMDCYSAEVTRAYGQQCRDEALEACRAACEKISDEYQHREGLKWPEMKTDAQTGAAECESAIRALKTPPPQGEPR